MALEPGRKLKSFALEDQDGKRRTMDDLMGRKGLVLYFYPRDNTSGCTKEAVEFSEMLTKFRRRGYNVVGVSKDSVASHRKFVDKHGLKLTLLSDPDKILLQAAGAWGEKKNYGKVSMGTIRSTLVLAPDGRVLKSYSKVKAAGHAEKVYEDLGSLSVKGA